MNRSRWLGLIFVFAIVLLAIFFHFAISFEAIKGHESQLLAYRAQHPLKAVFLFCAAYIFLTSIMLPGASSLTLVGGAIFGLWWGTIIVSFVSTIGATVAFWLARWLFRNWLEAKYHDRLETLRAGVAKNEISYLLSLRLNPVIPFWLINLLMGLTAIRTRRYFWVSQIGMLPGTILYVNAGVHLAHLDSLQAIRTPSMIVAFLLLAAFPLVARRLSRLLTDRPQSVR